MAELEFLKGLYEEGQEKLEVFRHKLQCQFELLGGHGFLRMGLVTTFVAASKGEGNLQHCSAVDSLGVAAGRCRD